MAKCQIYILFTVDLFSKLIFFKQIISCVRGKKRIGQLFELLTNLSHGTGSQFAIFLSDKVLFYAGKLYFPIKFSNLMTFFCC